MISTGLPGGRAFLRRNHSARLHTLCGPNLIDTFSLKPKHRARFALHAQLSGGGSAAMVTDGKRFSRAAR
jgi:hypothetical protein